MFFFYFFSQISMHTMLFDSEFCLFPLDKPKKSKIFTTQNLNG